MVAYEALNSVAEPVRKALAALKEEIDRGIVAGIFTAEGSRTSIGVADHFKSLEHAVNGCIDEAYEDLPLIERMKSPEAGNIQIHFYHGREDPEQDMDDWGEDGPTLYCQWIHFAYLSDICLGIEGDADHGPAKEDGIFFHNDMVAIKQGEKTMYYGDWEIVVSQRG